MTRVMREIIQIDEDLCNGCGECIVSCEEAALQLVDTPNGKKARLIKDIYCDGMGNCIGSCPVGAITIIQREAEEYDEKATEEWIKQNKQKSRITPHHGGGCPGTRMMNLDSSDVESAINVERIPSRLKQWPVQLHLVSPMAPYFKGTDLVFAADCVPFAYPNFHEDFLKDKAIAIACPKLDNTQPYLDKITAIIQHNRPRSVHVVIMEVPCCGGLARLVHAAIQQSGLDIPFTYTVISVRGERLN